MFLAERLAVLLQRACSKSLLQRQTRQIISIDICGADALAVSDLRRQILTQILTDTRQGVHRRYTLHRLQPISPKGFFYAENETLEISKLVPI